MGEMQHFSELDFHGRGMSTDLKPEGSDHLNCNGKQHTTSEGPVKLGCPLILPVKSKRTKSFPKNVFSDSDSDGYQPKGQHPEPNVLNCRMDRTSSSLQAMKQTESYESNSSQLGKANPECSENVDMLKENSLKQDMKGNFHAVNNSVASQNSHLNECGLEFEPARFLNHAGLRCMSPDDPVINAGTIQHCVHCQLSPSNHFHHGNSLFLSRSPDSVPRHHEVFFSSIAAESFDRTTHFLGQTTRNLLTGSLNTNSSVQNRYAYLSTGFPRDDTGGFVGARATHASFIPMTIYGEGSSDQLNFSGYSATQLPWTLPYGIFIDHVGFPCHLAQPPPLISCRHLLDAPDIYRPSGSRAWRNLILPHRNPSLTAFQQDNRSSNTGASSLVNNDNQEQNSAQQSERSSTMNYEHHLTFECCLSEIFATLEHIEDLTHEQIMMLEETVQEELGLHDQYRDMRLDVDNMSYEELSALGERMGVVNVGLHEETISKCIRKIKYSSSATSGSSGLDDADMKCSICQDEFDDGQELGRLDCQHNYHVACIEQWLGQKNQCPICKSSAC